ERIPLRPADETDARERHAHGDRQRPLPGRTPRAHDPGALRAAGAAPAHQPLTTAGTQVPVFFAPVFAYRGALNSPAARQRSQEGIPAEAPMLAKRFERIDALLLVDVQRDFFPGGPMEVAGAEDIVPVLNEWITQAREQRIPIVAARD